MILWEKPEPRELIRTGSFEVVVLQEDIPETTVASFREYARTFIAEVRGAKSRPILLMAWSYSRRGWISTDEIARAHREAAKELGVVWNGRNSELKQSKYELRIKTNNTNSNQRGARRWRNLRRTSSRKSSGKEATRARCRGGHRQRE